MPRFLLTRAAAADLEEIDRADLTPLQIVRVLHASRDVRTLLSE